MFTGPEVQTAAAAVNRKRRNSSKRVLSFWVTKKNKQEKSADLNEVLKKEVQLIAFWHANTFFPFLSFSQNGQPSSTVDSFLLSKKLW